MLDEKMQMMKPEDENKKSTLKKAKLCDGLSVQSGEDGHWLCFDNDGLHAMVNVENMLGTVSIASKAVIGFIDNALCND